MSRTHTLSALTLFSAIGIAHAQSAPRLDAQTTLPVVITRSISADHSKAGDPVLAKTFQIIRLPDGTLLPSGARVTGHVIVSEGFAFDKTPYAKQKSATLSVRFDYVQIDGQEVPLNVTIRAFADQITSNDAYAPLATDLDSRSTRTLIGGDKLYASQDGVENMDGDVVAYNRRSGVYAHLIPNGTCDGSSVEVSMGIYSPSSCGAYGFAGIHVTERGSASVPSTLTLVSNRRSPELPKHATALLEVLPSQQASVAR
jgi:hypothetical protein